MKKGGGRIVVMVPYPAQGHVSPMQKLASAFVCHGLEPLIVLPKYMHTQLMTHDHDHHDDGIKWVALPDGGLDAASAPPDFFGIESAMENCMPAHLEDMLVAQLGGAVACVVVDLLASWAIPVAASCAIPTAGFWPAMFATYRLIQSIPNMLRSALISHTGLPEHEGQIRFVPDLPIISTEDLPWLIGTVASKKARFKFWMRTLERSRSLKWVLVNSFPGESEQLAKNKWAQGEGGGYPRARVLPIGPMCSSRSVSLWEEDRSCLKWLARQRDGSVVYISFGSWVGPIGEAKVRNIALALEASGRPFIWVLRSDSSWREGLPAGFVERALKQGRGRVVAWAPQTQILQHKCVGCYITHCGWNSTMEALQSRKRLLCYPVAGDQFVNCAYVVQVWRVGLRLAALGQRDVEEGLARLMEDKEMDTRLMSLYETIMGTRGQGANATRGGPFFLKAFLEDLKKEPSTLV